MLKNQGILKINLEAISTNYARLKQEAGPETKIAAVVKANGYGLGAGKIAEILSKQGCQDFCVFSPEEGQDLRRTVKNSRIFILCGFTDEEENVYTENNLIPMIGSFEEIEAYKKLAQKQNRKLTAFLNFSASMNRLGFGADDTTKLLADKNKLDGIEIAGIMTHFACADEASPMNESQYEFFKTIAAHFPNAEKSMCNSPGLFRDKKYHYDLARCGMALYGLNPAPEMKNPMQPVVSISLPVISRRAVQKNESVGYGASYIFDKPSQIATVSAGYADGISRSLSNKGALYWKGYKCPIRGRVSMDLTAVSLENVPEHEYPHPGDMMEFIGPHQDADTVANDAGTIGYEILTSLGRRYKREYI